MSGCQFKSRLDAYYDGELSAVEAEQMTRHLGECKTCVAELARLRELSVAMANHHPAPISQIELARLHRNLDVAEDRSLVRLSTALATLAASVLIISLTWITQTPGMRSAPSISSSTDGKPDWYRMAMGEPPRAPVMNNNLGIPEKGLAIQDKETINWMLDGIH